MGKRSVKTNKNIYQLCREEAGLTREKASELLQFISADRIEKVESGHSAPHPDEILLMAECYGHPELKNHFCTVECPIGQKHVKPVKEKELTMIALEILNSLNTLSKDKERLVEIAADGQLTEDELKDFSGIREKLDAISATVQSLYLWMEKHGI